MTMLAQAAEAPCFILYSKTNMSGGHKHHRRINGGHTPRRRIYR